MIKITVCPSCGSSEIRKVQKDYSRDFEGQRYVVPDLEHYECRNCGERIFDREAMRKIEASSPAFERRYPKRKTA